MRPADGITVSTLVAVDPATAFAVFIDEVDVWWRRGPKYRTRPGSMSTMRFEPGVGGRLVEVFDEAAGDLFEIGRIRTWEPGRLLAFDWRGPNFEPGQSTAVEVRFEAVPQGTRVTVEHSGWYGLPQDHPVRHGLPDDAFARMWGGWWRDQMTSLRTLVATRAPHSPG